MSDKFHPEAISAREAAADDSRQQLFSGAVLLFDGFDGSQQLKSFMRCDSVSEAVIQLMESIRTNRLWYEMKDANLVGRSSPQPMLAVFGHFSSSELARWRDLAMLIKEGVLYHRHIDYAEAEAAAQLLAEKLVACYGRIALSHFHFTAIPRGGVIVLGILSYILDLKKDQIFVSSSLPANCQTLVVVDDCSLSGLRFQQFLKQLAVDRVVLCTLCSVPELCRMIEQREIKVEKFINAIDLYDLGEQRFGENYPKWRAEQRSLMGEDGYWVGIPQPVSFAWSEPQTTCWNAERKEFEASWNLVPPHLCIKRRIMAEQLERSFGMESGGKSITFIDDKQGGFRAASRVLWVRTGSVISIARIPDTSQFVSCFCLDGVAADMWESLLLHGTLDGVCEELVDLYDVDPEVFFLDLMNFIAELTTHNLLAGYDSH
ncbi:MAG: PqqD family protein [Pseudomonadota bacterium]